MANLINQFHKLSIQERMSQIASDLRAELLDNDRYRKEYGENKLSAEQIELARDTILLCQRFLEPVWLVTSTDGTPVAFARGHLTVKRTDKIRRKAIWRGAIDRHEPLQFKEIAV